MAAPQSSKKGPTGRATKQQSSASSTVSGKGAPAKEISIPYRAAPDFRYVPATGSMVRAKPDGATFTFVLDERRALSQKATLVEKGKGYETYQAGPLNEETFRLMQVGVILPLKDALSLAMLLIQKVGEADPKMPMDLTRFLETKRKEK